MDQEFEKMKCLIRTCLRHETKNVFSKFCQSINELSCTTIREINKLNKEKGTIWEFFCREYIMQNAAYSSAILLKDVDTVTLEKLSLKKIDVGIDIIAFDIENRPIAIQCKFRKKGAVSWRDISTFEALCARSGPWYKKIVMTNAAYVRREGRKDSSDVTIGFGSFASLQRHEWNAISGLNQGIQLHANNDTSPEYIKCQWLARLEQQRV